MLFSFGLDLKMNVESAIRKLNSFRFEPRMSKLSMDKECVNRPALPLMPDGLGYETRQFVLGLPRQCLMLPMDSSAHCLRIEIGLNFESIREIK